MKVTKLMVESSRLPAAFHGYKIAHVSDLHNKDYKGALLSEIDSAKVNAIVITGDLIDRETKIDAALKFAAGAVKLAPVYYVNGNHESVLKVYPEVRRRLEIYGVNVLENETAEVVRQGTEGENKIVILGMSDPRFFEKGKPQFREELARQSASLTDEFVILLTHRPEMFRDYVAAKIDLTFVGHAHGGQVRLPFIGALYAPNQGLFPKLTKGLHSRNDSLMVISCGMGSSNLFPRIFNNPELIVVTLNCKNTLANS